LAGAAGAGLGAYIAKQLYPNTPVGQLTESEKQTISALSTLAGGLAGGLSAGGLNNAIAAAGAAKNAVENNNLTSIEYASLDVMLLKYNSSCVGVSSQNCTRLKAEIEALFKKAQSVLKDEPISLDSDATRASKLDHKPGDIVMCHTSYTSFCVVTDQSVKTADGDEWYLKPATVEQALEGRANQEKMTSDTIASLKQIAVDSFNEGCGGSLGIGIVCQLSMGFGATNPITETKATTGERIGWFAQALLNIVGLKAAIGSTGAKGAVIPKGISSADDFSRFSTDTRDGLARAGYGNVEPILQGSAVTGKSFKTGQEFDVGRVSDFDIALASPELLQRAQSLGIGLRSGGSRTGPLSARDLQTLGLKDLSSKLSAQSGREVNFMIYESAATAASLAPSVVLPK
jgi:filamentous hemagglutinin